MQSLILPTLERLQSKSTNDLSHFELLLRTKLFGWACQLEMDLCQDYAEAMWTRWMYQHDPDIPAANP